jgi:AcrR family transcriptional regulator
VARQHPVTPAGRVRRGELAAVAYAQIAALGLEGLRIREVAREAGLNHATLLHYFPTKEDLVEAVVDHLLTLLVTPVTEAPAPGAGTIEQLRHELADIAIRLEQQPQLFLVLTELQSRAVRDPAVATALARLDAAWHSYLAGMVRTGISRGELRAELDPDRAARLLMVLFRGMGLEALRRPAGPAASGGGPALETDPAGLTADAGRLIERWLRP